MVIRSRKRQPKEPKPARLVQTVDDPCAALALYVDNLLLASLPAFRFEDHADAAVEVGTAVARAIRLLIRNDDWRLLCLQPRLVDAIFFNMGGIGLSKILNRRRRRAASGNGDRRNYPRQHPRPVGSGLIHSMPI